MRLALLGLDDQTQLIARAAAASGRHQIALACDLPPADRSMLKNAMPGAEEGPWELLLHEGRIDGVVVASPADTAGNEFRAEQLRRLVQAAVPMLIAHPVVDSLIVYYELEMMRQDSRCIIVPYLPARWSPAAARLAELVAAGDQSLIGAVDQAVFESSPVRRGRGDVLAQFARDVDVIRVVCGDVTRIGAMGSPDAKAALANLGVQMSGAGPILTRWSIAPADDLPNRRLTLVGSRGKAVLHLPDDGAWQLEIRPTGASQAETVESTESADWSAPVAALEALAEALARQPMSSESNGTDNRGTEWAEAIRGIELAEAIGRSLARGRTIEVQREELSETNTFKSLMTAFGCGILMVAAGLIFGIALLAQIAKANGWQWLAGALNSWPWVVLAVLGLFMVFQLLLRLAEPPSGKKSG